jgi:glutamyl-tRNA synthetase
VQTLGEALDMLRFLLTDDLVVDEAAAAKQLGTDGQAVLAVAEPALATLAEWSTPAIESALRAALVDPDTGLGLKPRNAFGPVRVAVTGRRISPPLFESLELLGSERSLARLAAAATG